MTEKIAQSLLGLLESPLPGNMLWRDGLNLIFAAVICLNAAEGDADLAPHAPQIHQCHAELVMLAEAMEAVANGAGLDDRVNVKTSNDLAITHGDILRRIKAILENATLLFESVEPVQLAKAVAGAPEELREIAETLRDVPQDVIIFALYDMVDILSENSTLNRTLATP